MTTIRTNAISCRFLDGRRGFAAAGVIALCGVLGACEGDSNRRVPSLFSTDAASAGDTNNTMGGADIGNEATGAPSNRTPMYPSAPRTNSGTRR